MSCTRHQRFCSSSSPNLLLHCAVYPCGFRAGESAIHSPLTSFTRKNFFTTHPVCVRCRFTLWLVNKKTSPKSPGEINKKRNERGRRRGKITPSQARIFFHEEAKRKGKKRLPKTRIFVVKFKTRFGKRTRENSESSTIRCERRGERFNKTDRRLIFLASFIDRCGVATWLLSS